MNRRPSSLAEVARETLAGHKFDPLLREFLDEFYTADPNARQLAIPALVVAMAGNPVLANIFALTASHAFGNSSVPALCRSRKRLTFDAVALISRLLPTMRSNNK